MIFFFNIFSYTPFRKINKFRTLLYLLYLHVFISNSTRAHFPLYCRVRTGAITSTKSCMVDHDTTIQGKPYKDIPGPRPIPILGNTWRLFPLIGQYEISDVAKLSQIFYDEYGKIVRLAGLIGRPDLLFVYDADEIEKIYRQEGPTPFRPSMPCLVHYKSVVRKDFFGNLPGVVGVYVYI